MNTHHSQILSSIKKASNSQNTSTHNKNYLGTTQILYSLRSSQLKQLTKEFKNTNKDISYSDFSKLLNSLNKANSFEEKIMVRLLLDSFPTLKNKLNFYLYDNWLENLSGWAEIDSYCQSAFSAKEMEANWAIWKKMLISFSKNKSISKRRASLVFLTKPVRDSKDNKFTKLAFENIDRLKHEKDILITKAISWLLREMVKNHKKSVAHYLKENETSLPKIALRETKRKIKTGKK